MDWNLVLTILSVIGILISAAIWAIVLVTRVTTRVRDTERDILDQKERIKNLEDKTSFENLEKITQRDILDQKERIKNLEDKTSFENLEKVTQRVLTQAIHSKEFKESMRDVILHVSKNHYAEESGVMSDVLETLERIKEKL